MGMDGQGNFRSGVAYHVKFKYESDQIQALWKHLYLGQNYSWTEEYSWLASFHRLNSFKLVSTIFEADKYHSWSKYPHLSGQSKYPIFASDPNQEQIRVLTTVVVMATENHTSKVLIISIYDWIWSCTLFWIRVLWQMHSCFFMFCQ